jgi:hypothetical protein
MLSRWRPVVDSTVQQFLGRTNIWNRRVWCWITGRISCHNNYDYSSSVTTMLENLKWQPLEERRMNTRLCLLYKAVNGLVAIPVQQYLIPLNRPSRHSNSLSFQLFSTRHDYFKYSFSPRTVVQWNLLPDATVKASTCDAFRACIAATKPLTAL